MYMSSIVEPAGRLESLGEDFGPMKVLLCVDLTDLNCRPNIRILHAQQSFFSTLGYTPTDLPLLLVSILSEASGRIVFPLLESALVAWFVLPQSALLVGNDCALFCHHCPGRRSTLVATVEPGDCTFAIYCSDDRKCGNTRINNHSRCFCRNPEFCSSFSTRSSTGRITRYSSSHCYAGYGLGC
jgi:hypothetical protein